jgi:2-polyprenyl-3-methyl-5-hydroxy-6-metoxy-1,4-benzoquinol methylase
MLAGLVNQARALHKARSAATFGRLPMVSPPATKEPQYSLLFDVKEKHGISRLGLMVNESWNQDPKRTLFTLARYKFVAKMLAGRDHVLEVGCADAFGTRIVQQAVRRVTAVDFDPLFIADVQERTNPNWPLEAFVHDVLKDPLPGRYDAAYALDVLEHIPEADEHRFIGNVVASLAPTGIVIFGMPSLESQSHASPQSKAGHVNCKSGDALKRTIERHFHTVFVFSMNDEVVHTGFYPMAHYLLAIGCHRRDT